MFRNDLLSVQQGGRDGPVQDDNQLLREGEVSAGRVTDGGARRCRSGPVFVLYRGPGNLCEG